MYAAIDAKVTMRVERVGRYEVIDTLARGGMGVVYKARDPLIDRIVAVKTLGFGLSPIEAEAFRKRFAREAKSAGRLNHPNIVTIHDMGESEDCAYIAMEFLDGRSLRDVLDSGVVMPPARAARIAADVADGLAFAHRHDVVHCDIKPANIMVLDTGSVKIMDFGIATLPTGSRTFAGNLLGSPRYISPEQILGRAVDARSDLFALGAVLYEMLTGVPPFAGDSIDEILYQVINHKPEAPSQRNRAIPAEFDPIVERAMAKDADDRYASASQMAAALRPLAERGSAAVLALPPLHGARPTAAPGATTVSIVGDDPHSASPVAWRRVLLRVGVPLLVVVVVVALALRTLATGDQTRVAQSSANASATAALKQAMRPAPAVIPPLATTPVESPPPIAPGTGAGEAPPAGAAAAAIVVPVPPGAASAAIDARALAKLNLAISPWGEVFVDGKRRGVTPPLTEIRLPPGRYDVEIRNSSFPAHRETVELFADAPLRIKHKFQ